MQESPRGHGRLLGARPARRRSRLAGVAVSCAGLLVAATALAGCTDGAGPDWTKAKASQSPPKPIWDRSPASIAAVGDSITRGFDACGVLSDCPEVSWATGTDDGVRSLALRLLGKPGAAERSWNYARSGASVAALPAQMRKAAEHEPDLVTVMMGANDACKDDAALMTPVDEFRTSFVESMRRLRADSPRTHVYVASVPDLKRLWSEGRNNPLGRQIWKLGICASMLGESQDMGAEAQQRRSTVQARVVAYNKVLKDVCAKDLRCRYDGGAVFDFRFTGEQLSTWDWFHPSKNGQGKLADIAYRNVVAANPPGVGSATVDESTVNETMTPEPAGSAPDGSAVHRWTLERAGVRVRVLTYGGILQSVEVPDRDGARANVVLGFDDVAGYAGCPSPYFGALIGRYANRIAGGAFTLDGRTYRLPRNNGPNCLHGGERGFDKRVWDAEPAADGHGVRLSLVSPDGEEGFPGRLEVSATYSLDAAGALRIAYRAVTDAATVLNLTNHSYWNLGGAGAGSAAGHVLRIAAGHLTPLDGDSVPAGPPAPVDGTRFDFREPRKVGSGYDHNFVLDHEGSVAAELYDPASGRVLTVTTTEPGMQLYTGDHFDAGPFGPGEGIALETQHFPDSPNRPDFPSTVLRPGEEFTSETVYGFGLL